ncbi:hypothetical protein BDR05DRAFT_719300 [Suillus weaverae]|nr:hypothetical protein BDR05DRAFT_719300 [Suillus weaverae]
MERWSTHRYQLEAFVDKIKAKHHKFIYQQVNSSHMSQQVQVGSWPQSPHWCLTMTVENVLVITMSCKLRNGIRLFSNYNKHLIPLMYNDLQVS